MSFIKKWYIYQKERFPILTFGLYSLCIVIAVFGFANSYGEIYYHEWIKHIVLDVTPSEYQINYISIIPMFAVTFLQFLMVRIVDEFKDYEEDCKYRPYRPVPRGLVTLKELKILFIICAILQLIITVVFTKNITYLIILWIFFWIMSKGFFIKKILDKHILLEVTLDELMMPLMVIFLLGFTSFTSYMNYNSDVSLSAEILSIAKGWKILLLSYLVSWIVEVARKIRAKDQEEKGVKTYTAVFGIPKAIAILAILETLLAIVQYMILGINYIVPITLIYGILNIINILFVIKKSKTFSKMVELSANIYIMLVYLSMLLLIV